MPNDCTTNQLVSIYHDVCLALENRKDIQLIFFDISKAFDKVWHKGLIFKLRQIGVGGSLLSFFENYLDNRKQRVVVNGKHSSYQCINAGVPQGSVLGPLLFLVYINDIANHLTSKATLYADDTTLSKQINDSVISTHELQNDLHMIDSWATKWKVKFNPTKSESLLISRKKDMNELITYSFQNQHIIKVENHTHLALIWSNDGTWKRQLSNTLQKAVKRLDMLRALKFKVQRSELERIYFAFVRPILEYGSIVWDSAPRHEKHFTEMEKLQIQAARIVTGCNNYASKLLLYRDTGWDTLRDRRERQRLILFYKIINGLAPQHLCNIINSYVNITDHRYTFRNNNIQQIFSRTETFRSSYFPCSIRLWNALPPSVRNVDSLSQFKCKLNNSQRVKNKCFNLGDRKINTILGSIRLRCSQLNDDITRNNILNNNKCICGSIETASHYFFDCMLYANERITLYNQTRFVELSLPVILNGNINQDLQHNKDLHAAVSSFIYSSNRFKWIHKFPW